MNKRQPIIKPKTKAFVDKLVNNPKMTYTDAYLATHDTIKRNVAAVEGSRLANSPAVLAYMEKHTDKAQERIVELMKQDYDKR
jgi:phage terminase small subunit